jgi:hypothetical protein
MGYIDSYRNMFIRTTSTKFFAPRRQDRKEKYFPISPNLASFAPLRLAPWNILSTEALSFHSRHYFTGRVPWNTDSTKIELFTRNAIPQGSPRGVLTSTQAEYDPQGVTPLRGISPRQKIYRFRREVIPQGESSFIRFPKPKFNGKFQISLARPYLSFW